MVKIMKESVIKQVLALQSKNTAELKELWRSIFDTDAPPHSKTYLIPRLAYRLQELAYGPMAEKSAKQLSDENADLEEQEKSAKQLFDENADLEAKEKSAK